MLNLAKKWGHGVRHGSVPSKQTTCTPGKPGKFLFPNADTQTFLTTLANASTISPILRLRFGNQLSRYKSQARVVTMATPSKIPQTPMEGRKGRLHPLHSFAFSSLYRANGVELLTQTGIPSLTHLRITEVPEPPLLYLTLSLKRSMESTQPPSQGAFLFPQF